MKKENTQKQPLSLSDQLIADSDIKYKTVFEMSPIGIMIYDVKGFVRAVNPATLKDARRPIEDYMNKHLSQLKAADIRDIPKFLKLFANVLRRRIREPFVVRYVRGDGTKGWTEIYFSVLRKGRRIIGIQTMQKDITDQVLANEELRRSEEKYKSLAENLPELVYRGNPENFEINYVNNAVEKIYGYTLEEWLKDPKMWSRTIHPDDKEEVLQKLTEAWKKKKPIILKYRIVKKDNKIGWVNDHVNWEKGKFGRLVSMSGILYDITERKLLEEQLIVTDRLATIGELVSGVAHELNNPLTSVIGFSELMLKKDISTEMAQYLIMIDEEAKRAAGIISQLLTFARKHETKRELLNINEIITNVLDLRAYEQKVNDIEVIARLDSNLPKVKVDSFRLNQVFLNIIINAEQSMIESRGRGTLIIATERVGEFVRISITDDGNGITKENLRHIFDPFFTTKKVGEGTGLGLSICYGIIAEHGGQIYANSALGKGATFIIEIPINA